MLLPMSADSIFQQKHKGTGINYLISQSRLVSDLLLLAAFPKPSGDPYARYGALMELWTAWGWLYVAVQLSGIE